jgi:glycosyltransferase involved in cell wall biosynthesis
MNEQKYLADFSLALINRTGAYFISRDIVESLSRHFYRVRYWRMNFAHPPQGLFRQILARLMIKDIDWLASTDRFRWPDAYLRGRLPTVFFDPLYVLRSRLTSDDIVLCHDVGPVSHPELFDASTTTHYEDAYEKIRAAKPGMMFVSESSKQAFRSRYGDDFRFLCSVPLYVRPSALKGELVPIEGISPPFLLTVAALERRKNYLRVMEAYTRAGLHSRGIGYVFCGPRGNATEEILAAAAHTPGVIACPYVSESQLRWLYANATGFVLPSLLEGFGVPALEAAGAGLVPLVGGGGAQEEAIGGNGVLVDPTSVDSIVAGLETLVGMKYDERAALVARARAHAETLTLDRFLGRWQAVLENNDLPAVA